MRDRAGLVKVAVAGLGYWGPNHLRNLVAVLGPSNVMAVDTSSDRLQWARTHYPGVTCTDGLDAALLDPELGAVIICTPVSTHARLTARCLEAGRHVLVEKPLSDRTTDAAALVSIAERRGVTLMVGHTFLFSPRVQHMRDTIRNGCLGEIQYVTSSRLNLGLHQRDIGVVWDLGPHDLSILCHLLDEFPVEVQTAGRAVVKPGSLDVAFLFLRFASGVVGAIDISWLSPRKVRKTVIVGDQQMLVYDDLDNEEPVKIYDKGVVMAEPTNFGEHQLTYRYGDVVAPHVPSKEPLTVELEHFLSVIARGKAGLSDGLFGLRVVETLEAAEQSWLEGGIPVPVHRHHDTVALPLPPLPAVPPSPDGALLSGVDGAA